MPSFKKNQPQAIPFVSNTKGLDYELIDCGNQRKLERFGKVVLNRPEIEAKWTPKLGSKSWAKAHWYFFEEKGKKGQWKSLKPAPKAWEIEYKTNHQKLFFQLELTAFKHIGIFPEQAENWHFIANKLASLTKQGKVLNLFAYTGAASVVAASFGARVTNVDSVKQVLNWGRSNGEKNSVEGIRWILEDARKYVEKALRRDEKFDIIILDPPSFGYGAKRERWKIDTDLAPLLSNVSKLLEPKQGAIILNTYSPQIKAKHLKQIVSSIKEFPPQYSIKQLGLRSSQEQTLPLGNLLRTGKAIFG